MSKHLIRQLNTFSAVIVVTAILSIYSCTEEIDYRSRYTFVGNTVASFLQDYEGTYSSFLYILEKGGMLSLLKAYGTYTCFAPTNEAVERFLVEQDSIWKASQLPGAKKVIWTGVTSPKLEELSDSMCMVIAKTHILPRNYMINQLEGDVIPSMNFNDRHLTIRYGLDSHNHSLLYINDAPIVHGDNMVENGVVHTIGAVMSTSSSTVPAAIEDMPFLSIFSEALKQTGLDQTMQKYKDENYTDGDKTGLTDRGESKSCPYPPSRYFGFTAFCEPDSVFNQQGIFNVDDLYRKCREWYPEATDPDLHSPNNALWRFMAYHFLDRKLLYTRLVCYNVVFAPNGDKIFDSEVSFPKYGDRTEYYETMQGTVMKVCMPRSNDIYRNDILINYAVDLTNPAAPYECRSGKHDIPVNVRIKTPSEIKKDKYPNYVQEALNGAIHLLDCPLVYDEDVMTGHVLNEIIRINFAALCPELTNNNVRWGTGDGISFGTSDYEYFIPKGYCEGIKFNTEEMRLYYLSPHSLWSDYQSDEMWGMGGYDISYRLPHVPPGTYELRMGYAVSPNRGVVQFYIDDVITGIPIDMRIAMSDPRIGYLPDAETEDNGVTNDKQMKNRGYYKGPTSYLISNGTSTARQSASCARRVIVTKYLSEGDHWLRFKNVKENPNSLDHVMHNYFELVPVGLLRRDDLSLEEKRK